MPLDPFPITGRPARLAVLISGGGTTLANLLDHIRQGEFDAEIPVVICSNRKAQAAVAAKDLGLRVELVERKTFDSTEAFSEAVFAHIRDAGADLICLAGFLSLLAIPDDYAQRILNIHPALLPAFGGKGMHGRHVHEAVLNAGVKITGCTVHFADQTYDTGPIVLQRICAVRDNDTPDTLAARVFEQECLAYPDAVRRVLAGQVRIVGRVTRQA